MVRKLASPLLLSLLLVSFSIGWNTRSAAPEGLIHPVNMTLSGGMLYVSDDASGLHVFDVSDRSAPRSVKFIPLFRNRGTAVKDDIVFASEGGDLLAIRITESDYTIVARLTSATGRNGGYFIDGPIENSGYGCTCGSTDTPMSAPAPTGGGSSYATFALVGDYLYRADYARLVVYDVSTPAKPKEIGRSFLGWPIETIQPTDDYLFVGGTTGMFVFSRSNPAKPALIGMVQYVRGCDPVVVSGPVAYVTLRGNSGCGQAQDELLCVNIENPAAPQVIAEKLLGSPYGLGVNDPYLYVSNGNGGYTLLDVAEPSKPTPLAAWTDWPTRDFIWSDTTLFVLGRDDLRIFDVTDPRQPTLVATIESGTS